MNQASINDMKMVLRAIREPHETLVTLNDIPAENEVRLVVMVNKELKLIVAQVIGQIPIPGDVVTRINHATHGEANLPVYYPYLRRN